VAHGKTRENGEGELDNPRQQKGKYEGAVRKLETKKGHPGGPAVGQKGLGGAVKKQRE